MKQIDVSKITAVVSKLYVQANFCLPQDVLKKLNSAYAAETSESARGVLNELIQNAALAAKQSLPLCQDTGISEIFVEAGQDVCVIGGALTEAVNKGISKGCKDGYLRNSIVKDPFDRLNTGDNTPGDIHYEIVPGDKIKITVLPKGGGSENTSALKMLNPSDGWQGVRDFVLGRVKLKGANACPPLVLGIGIGGSFSSVALLAKKALLLDMTENSDDIRAANQERELLKLINALNIGPMGLGGAVTCLGVRIVKAPCHIASLPCAVSMGCHSTRKMSEII